MKELSGSQRQDGAPGDDRFSDEMRGFVDLGMHAEALTLAREFLRRDPLQTGAFNAALDGLLVSEDRLTSWTRLVGSAYARLPKRARRQVKSAIFNFYYSIREFEKAASFIPKRLSEPIALLDAAFAIDTLVYVNRLKEARVWVRRVERCGNLSVDSWEGGVLLSRVAEFYAKVCDFEQAIRLLEPLRTHRGVAESAILGIVELRVAQALRAVKEGFAALREMRANPDSELAVTLPGTEDSRWQKAEKELKKLEKRILNVMPQHNRNGRN